jgi:hypothetical protein
MRNHVIHSGPISITDEMDGRLPPIRFRSYEQERDERKRQVLAGLIPGDIVRDRRERSKRLFDDVVKHGKNMIR